MKTGKNSSFTVVAAIAAGVGLGLLFAPAKGTKTRKRLKKKAKMFFNDLSSNPLASAAPQEDVEEKSPEVNQWAKRDE